MEPLAPADVLGASGWGALLAEGPHEKFRHQILIRAIELAESGRHIDCITIETTLVAEGLAEAHEFLKNERLRSGLRAICQKHWRGDGAVPVDNIIDFKAKAASMIRGARDEPELT